MAHVSDGGICVGPNSGTVQYLSLVPIFIVFHGKWQVNYYNDIQTLSHTTVILKALSRIYRLTTFDSVVSASCKFVNTRITELARLSRQ
jgi:hypothetical protein